MIFCLRTDTPVAEMSILEGDKTVATYSWQADRQLARDLLKKIITLLEDHHLKWSDLSGLIVYRGPGSFTGLRIGCTVMNTIAYAQQLSIVGESGDQWLKTGKERLSNGDNDRNVMPEYGAEPRVTQPRK